VVYNYDKDVAQAEISPIRDIIFQKFPPREYKIRLANFEEDYYKGVDFWCGAIGVQVKQRRTYYKYDVCLEHHHEYEDGAIVKGWAHKETEAFWLYYYWDKCFKHTKDTIALVMQMPNLLCVVKNNAENWGEPIKNNEPTIRNGKSYYTYNHMIQVQTLRDLGVYIAHLSIPAN